MSGSIVRRFSRCVCDRIRSFRSLSSDKVGFRRYSAGPKDDDGDDDEEVTEEELKGRIQRFYDGDGEALPSIFEAILKRKLAGKNDEGLIDQLPIGGRPDLTDSSGESE
ncbi:hypothetical protein MLD38_030136 [Melastoma candidum]|uniref:Uncharacterized protein n=1 Tax=Melastoma candidum TaxID=119954 RepID=A0ACB9MMU0_9MYRT|nr:hypothetical protein MLD38_030136 [Melastoma candidum]